MCYNLIEIVFILFHFYYNNNIFIIFIIISTTIIYYDKNSCYLCLVFIKNIIKIIIIKY